MQYALLSVVRSRNERINAAMEKMVGGQNRSSVSGPRPRSARTVPTKQHCPRVYEVRSQSRKPTTLVPAR